MVLMMQNHKTTVSDLVLPRHNSRLPAQGIALFPTAMVESDSMQHFITQWQCQQCDWKQIIDNEESEPQPYPNTKNCKGSSMQHIKMQCARHSSVFKTKLLNKIMLEINRYAQQFLQYSAQHSPEFQAKNRKIGQNKHFSAVLLNMRPIINTASYLFTSSSQQFPCFYKISSRNQFQLPLIFFHLVNNKEIYFN
jgi:hypothetical protein